MYRFDLTLLLLLGIWKEFLVVLCICVNGVKITQKSIKLINKLIEKNTLRQINENLLGNELKSGIKLIKDTLNSVLISTTIKTRNYWAGQKEYAITLGKEIKQGTTLYIPGLSVLTGHLKNVSYVELLKRRSITGQIKIINIKGTLNNGCDCVFRAIEYLIIGITQRKKAVVLLSSLCFVFLFVEKGFTSPLNIAGFEEGDTSDCRSITGTVAASSTSKRTGAYGLRASPVTTAVGNCRISTHGAVGTNTTDLNVATVYTRFYLCTTTLPSTTEEQFIDFLDTGASDKVTFTLNSSGNIKAYNTSGTLVTTGTFAFANSDCTNAANYHRVEIKLGTGTTAAYEVKVDGSVDGSLTGTINSNTTNNGSIRYGKTTNLNGKTIDFTFDDINIDDTAYPGAGEIKKMALDSDGSSATWTSGTGASNYTQISEIPTDGDTTYESSITSGAALAGFESSSSAGVSGTINSVKVFTRFREGVDGSATTVVRIRSGATNSDSTANNLGTSYLNRFRLLNVDPADSAAWTTTDLDSIEAGLNEGTIAQVNRFTTMVLQVDFTASAATATPTPTPTPTSTPTNTPTATPTATPTNTPTPTPTPVVKLLAITGVGN